MTKPTLPMQRLAGLVGRPDGLAGILMLSALGASLAPAGARAVTFTVTELEATARAEQSLPEFSFSVSDQDEVVPPEFSAFAEVSVAGSAAAYQDVNGINAAFADSEDILQDARRYHAEAETLYDIEIETDRAPPGDVPFAFVINGGELRISDFDRVGVGSFAEVGVEITIFPGGFWFWTGTLSHDPFGGFEVESDLRLDSLGLGAPSLSMVRIGDDLVVDIPRFEGEVLLDPLSFVGAGQQFKYEMRAEVDLRDSLGGGALAGVSDPFGLRDGAAGTQPAVELFLGGIPFSDIDGAVLPDADVPEPAAGLLAGAGLLGLLATRRRRRPEPGAGSGG